MRDSGTAQPIAGVTILSGGSAVPHVTDSAGSFSVSGLDLGPCWVLFLKSGYSPRSLRITSSDSGGEEMDMGVVLLSQGPPPTPRIFGTVTDSMTGIPIAAAEVLVNGETVAVTDVSGRFSVQPIGLVWGSNLLHVRRMGYAPLASELWTVSQDADFNLDIELMPMALIMPEVVVEADRTVYLFGGSREFYRRIKSGLGHYITREEIQRRQPLLITDMVARLPGVSVGPAATGYRIRILRGGGCTPAYFLDGVPLTPFRMAGANLSINDMVNPDDVEGIELYKGPATIPPEFFAASNGCGIVAIWTRRR